MNWFLLSAAIVAFCFGHALRLLRWKMFIEIYEEPHIRNIVRSLALGGLGNLFLPFRGGDLLRAVHLGRRMKNGVSFSLATIALERCLDVLAVGLLFAVFYLMRHSSQELRQYLVFYMLFVCVLLVLLFVVIKRNIYIKIAVKAVSSIFSDSIRLHILFFAWSFILSFSDMYEKIKPGRLILYSLGMWFFYIASYVILSAAMPGYGLLNMFSVFFSTQGLSVTGISLIMERAEIRTLLAVYLTVPFLLMFLTSFPPRRIVDMYKARSRQLATLNILPQINGADRLRFLDSYFSGGNQDYLRKYLEINKAVHILEDLSAGSEATTLLCVDFSNTFYRKCAFASAAGKLGEQINWIKAHTGLLPLPGIIQSDCGGGSCFYDMPYSSSSLNFFNHIHSTPWEKSWAILEAALLLLEERLYVQSQRPLDPQKLDEYIESKVVTNIKKIMRNKAVADLQKFPELIINDRPYKNLSAIRHLLGAEHLRTVFANDSYSDIHGDLTVENIIVRLDKANPAEAFYLIDPNTGNIHDSPNLDYAKLLQSLHGGYEFYTKTQGIRVKGNCMYFLDTSSMAYSYLYGRYREFILSSFGPEAVRSIYFHELVHWLRLLPYKLKKNTAQSLLFYAGFIIILNDTATMFGYGNEKK